MAARSPPSKTDRVTGGVTGKSPWGSPNLGSPQHHPPANLPWGWASSCNLFFAKNRQLTVHSEGSRRDNTKVGEMRQIKIKKWVDPGVRHPSAPTRLSTPCLLITMPRHTPATRYIPASLDCTLPDTMSRPHPRDTTRACPSLDDTPPDASRSVTLQRCVPRLWPMCRSSGALALLACSVSSSSETNQAFPSTPQGMEGHGWAQGCMVLSTHHQHRHSDVRQPSLWYQHHGDQRHPLVRGRCNATQEPRPTCAGGGAGFPRP